MSVQTEIDRIISAVGAAYDAVEAKGGASTQSKTIENLAEAVNNIPSGSDITLGLTGAAVGQAPTVKAIDEQGKPTEWEPATLAKADGSNIPSNAMGTWRTNIAALPGVKVYGKADANGKIKAYTDAACTQEATISTTLGVFDYGNALLIYDHKTYQCAGFEEPASMQGSGNYLVVVFSRTDVRKNTAGNTVFTAETARMNIIDYLSGTIDAPITIETYTITDMEKDM